MKKLNKRILFYTIMVTLIYLALPPLHSLADAHYPKEPKTQLTSTFTRTGTVRDAWVISWLTIEYGWRSYNPPRYREYLVCNNKDEEHEHDEDCTRESKSIRHKRTELGRNYRINQP